jgi:uncharacterized protein (DUF1015 family)
LYNLNFAMAYISPFRALRYDPSKVTLSKAVTQPYDKITRAMQEHYYDASPYNLVRIILGKKEESDSAENNVYTRAASYFANWRRQGVLKPDSDPSIYLYVQQFAVPGGTERLERRGFIALGRVEDYANKVVYRHEQTLSKPKADRLDLLRATKAHFEQIFMLYSDPASEIDRALNPATPPDMETVDEYAVAHKVWKISDPKVVELVRSKMSDKKLIIADGHHRYETSLNYRNERRAAAGGAANPDAPYEFTVMTFVNMDRPGLVILPTHRVVHGLTSFMSDNLRDGAKKYFRVKEIDPEFDAAEATRILREAGKEGTALLAVTHNRAFLMDAPKSVGSSVLAGLSERQQSLDVVQLHKCLLEDVLGLSEESIRNQQNLSYIRDAGEALAQVRRGNANVTFLMNPAKIEQVRDIAFAGEVMPQKSTDFFPKMMSGFTTYALE